MRTGRSLDEPKRFAITALPGQWNPPPLRFFLRRGTPTSLQAMRIRSLTFNL